MSSREAFTWIGPVSGATSAGAVARGFVAGLERVGSLARVLDSGDGSVAPGCELDAAVRTRGSTIVRQSALSELGTTASIVPPEEEARQVAYVVVDGARQPERALQVLGLCHEVWAPSTLQAELLCSLGVERTRVRVVAPGTDICRARPGAAREDAGSSGSLERALVFGAAGTARELERLRAAGPRFEPALAAVGSPAFLRELERADAVVVTRDVDPWGRVALEAAALARPLLHVESGTALEYLDLDECVWFDAQTAADPLRLSRCLQSAFSDPRALQRRAERARARVESGESLETAARALVARATRPRGLPAPRLERLLAELGLPTSAERLAGSRPRVLVLPVADVEGTWPEELRAHLQGRAARTDTTLCLWVDEPLAARTAEISERVERELAQCHAAEVDVLVVVAPLAHAPRERLVTSAA